jgi:thioredoxin reductase (NADPH)
MSEIILYGAEWCPYCQSLKKFLEAEQIKFNYQDVDTSDDVKNQMLSLTDQNFLIPTIVIDGKAYQNPPRQQLAKLLDINIKPPKQTDVLIIGAGPSGLSSAIYTSRKI